MPEAPTSAPGDAPPDATLTSRRTLIRRAALLGAAAWTAPMLLDSVTSPAAAASCTQSTLDWNNMTTGAGGTTTCTGKNASIVCSSTAYTPAAVGGVSVTFSAAGFTGTTLLTAANNAGNGNLTVRAAPNGGLTSQKALQLQMLPNAYGIGQTLTISFSKTVSNVSFTLFDIDNLGSSGWADRLYTTPGPTSVAVTNAAWTPTTAHITGAGTGTSPASANPLMSSDLTNNYGDTSSLGNATLTYAGPLTQIVVTYYNVTAAVAGQTYINGGNQRIGIGPVSYCA